MFFEEPTFSFKGGRVRINALSFDHVDTLATDQQVTQPVDPPAWKELR